MPKMPKAESLKVEDLGDLCRYDEDELVRLREKLIANEQRIHQESAHLAKRIKELNQARNDLQHELAENARSMRAAKHALSQRMREDRVVLVPAARVRRANAKPPSAVSRAQR